MINPGSWRVYAGSISQNALQTAYSVKNIILHESYSNQNNDFDIALLKLNSPVDFSSESSCVQQNNSLYVCICIHVCVWTIISHFHLDTVQPVCLPTFDQNFSEDLECWTSGFGTTEEGAGEESSYIENKWVKENQ